MSYQNYLIIRDHFIYLKHIVGLSPLDGSDDGARRRPLMFVEEVLSKLCEVVVLLAPLLRLFLLLLDK